MNPNRPAASGPVPSAALPARALAPVGILLAGGLGTRFDPTGKQHKLLAALPDGGERGLPVAFVAGRRFVTAVRRVVAVVRPGNAVLADWLARAGCEVIVSADAERGMGASLAAAIRATPSAQGWVVALADMPSIAPATICRIAAAVDTPLRIVAPLFNGMRGHPVGFGPGHAAALAALDGDTGARELLRTPAVKLIDTLDAGVLRDIDTPADLHPGG